MTTPNAFTPRCSHAGGIVYRVDQGTARYAVVTASDDASTWVWPKGHIEPGEDAPRAALREVLEEAGITAQIVGELPAVTFTRAGEDVRVAYFLMRYVSSNPASEGRTIQWATFADCQTLLRHADQRDLLTAAQPAIISDLLSQPTHDTAVDLLLKDYDALSESLASNEAVTDARLSMFTGLVTAVIAGVIALASSESDRAAPLVHPVAIFSLTALLLLGGVLFFRVLKRNERTDDFVRDLRHLRALVRKRLDRDGLLASWHPFRPRSIAPTEDPEKIELRTFGGLSDMVAVINGILAGALSFLLSSKAPDQPRSVPMVIAFIVGTVVLAAQLRYARWRHKTRP